MSEHNPITVQVELVAWITTFVGGTGSGSQVYEEELPAGATVDAALRQLSQRFPKLHQSLWDPEDRSAIGPHIEIIVNDAILGVAHHLESPLNDGDRIILTGQYVGG